MSEIRLSCFFFIVLCSCFIAFLNVFMSLILPPLQHGPLPSNSILEYIEFRHETDLFMTEKEAQRVCLESGVRGPVQL